MSNFDGINKMGEVVGCFDWKGECSENSGGRFTILTLSVTLGITGRILTGLRSRLRQTFTDIQTHNCSTLMRTILNRGQDWSSYTTTFFTCFLGWRTVKVQATENITKISCPMLSLSPQKWTKLSRLVSIMVPSSKLSLSGYGIVTWDIAAKTLPYIQLSIL